MSRSRKSIWNAPARAPRRKPVAHEQQTQGAIVEFHAVAVADPRSAILFAVPNGEKRPKATAGKLTGHRRSASDPSLTDESELLRPAGQGVLPGAPDLVLLTGLGGLPCTDLIEVKVAADELRGVGKTYLKPAQKRFRDAVVALGHHHHVIRSVEEYEAILRARSVPLRLVRRFPNGVLMVQPPIPQNYA